MAVLESLHLRRPSTDRRSSIADFFAAFSRPRSANTGAELSGRRRDDPRHVAAGRDRGFAAGAGSWLASGGGAARRHRVCVWGLSRLAHPAPGTNSQPFLLADSL